MSQTIIAQVESDIVSANKLHIYSDGACHKNPGKSGSGMAVYVDDKEPYLFYGFYLPNGTNNTAELSALHDAILMAQTSNSPEITIFSDSKYSIDCITKWAYGWKSKNWTKKGGPIKNLDIIKTAHEQYDKIKKRIQVKHVKGHAGIEGNELADRMAGIAIKEQEKERALYLYEDKRSVLAL